MKKSFRCKPALASLLGWFACFFASSGAVRAAPAPVTKPSLLGQRVLWLGDSITQDGKYVSDVEYYLDKHFPEQTVDFVSIGLASETVSGLSEKMHPFPRPDLHKRFQSALDKVKPQVVVLCYGMNDGIYHPQSPERMKAFQDGINSVIASIRATGARILLLTPPPYDALPVKSVRPLDAADFGYRGVYEKYDGVLAEYSEWEKTLNAPDLLVVDLHTPLNEYIQAQRLKNPTFSFSRDGIHPDATGHWVMAAAILKALDLPVAPEGVSAEITKADADPLYGLVTKHRERRSDGWLSFVGYTRDKTVKSDSIDFTEQTASTLEAQINEARKVIKVACVGDSITAGSGVKDPQNRYPTALGRLLGDRYVVRNLGVGGATLLKKGDKPYWKQKAYTDALDWKPDVVIICLGTNDSKHPTTQLPTAVNNWQFKDEFLPNYEELIGSFKAASPAAKFYTCLMVPAYPGQWGINDTTIREEIVPLLRQISTDKGASTIDLYTALSGKAELFPDTVHPNGVGAGIIATTVYRALSGNEPPATATP